MATFFSPNIFCDVIGVNVNSPYSEQNTEYGEFT